MEEILFISSFDPDYKEHVRAENVKKIKDLAIELINKDKKVCIFHEDIVMQDILKDLVGVSYIPLLKGYGRVVFGNTYQVPKYTSSSIFSEDLYKDASKKYVISPKMSKDELNDVITAKYLYLARKSSQQFTKVIFAANKEGKVTYRNITPTKGDGLIKFSIDLVSGKDSLVVGGMYQNVSLVTKVFGGI